MYNKHLEKKTKNESLFYKIRGSNNDFYCANCFRILFVKDICQKIEISSSCIFMNFHFNFNLKKSKKNKYV